MTKAMMVGALALVACAGRDVTFGEERATGGGGGALEGGGGAAVAEGATGGAGGAGGQPDGGAGGAGAGPFDCPSCGAIIGGECVLEPQGHHEPECGAYVCTGETFGCPDACRDDVDCVEGAACVDHVCVP